MSSPCPLLPTCTFRECFSSAQQVSANGGVITGVPIINNGFTTTVASGQCIRYPNKRIINGPVTKFSITVDFTTGTNVTSISHLFGDYNDSTLSALVYVQNATLLCMIGGALNYGYAGGIAANTRYRITFTYDGSLAAGSRLTATNNGANLALAIHGTIPTSVSSTGTGPTVAGSSVSIQNVSGLTIHEVGVFTSALSVAEALDIYEKDTISEIDSSKALVHLPLRSWYYNGSNVAVTDNIGSLGGTATLGDGSTTTTFPTQIAPHGANNSQANKTYHAVPSSSSLSGIGDMTLACLVKVTASLDGAAITNYELFFKEDYNVSGYNLRIQNGSGAVAGMLQFRSNQAGTNQYIGCTSKGIFTGRIQSVIFVKSGSVGKFYVDGVVQADDGVALTNPVANSQILGIGGHTVGAQNLTGNVYLPQFYPFALSALQARALHNRMIKLLNV